MEFQAQLQTYHSSLVEEVLAPPQPPRTLDGEARKPQGRGLEVHLPDQFPFLCLQVKDLQKSVLGTSKCCLYIYIIAQRKIVFRCIPMSSATSSVLINPCKFTFKPSHRFKGYLQFLCEFIFFIYSQKRLNLTTKLEFEIYNH